MEQRIIVHIEPKNLSETVLGEKVIDGVEITSVHIVEAEVKFDGQMKLNALVQFCDSSNAIKATKEIDEVIEDFTTDFNEDDVKAIILAKYDLVEKTEETEEGG